MRGSEVPDPDAGPDAPILPMKTEVPQRATQGYKRHGTSDLYAALNITTGKVIGRLHARHRTVEFKQFLRTLDDEVPADLDVHVILDNSSTHKTPQIKRWLLAHTQVRAALQPEQQQLAQSRVGALVRGADQQKASPLSAHLRPPAQPRHPLLDQHLERRSPPLRLDQDRRPDPRIHQQLLPTGPQLRTLASIRQ